jgi:hypothetical protein
MKLNVVSFAGVAKNENIFLTNKPLEQIKNKFHQMQQGFLILKKSFYMFQSMMASIRRQSTLQRKCFTCIMCMCCLVTVKITVLKMCFAKTILFN